MSKKTYVYACSWYFLKAGDEYGIRGYEFDSETGEMKLIETVECGVLFDFAYYDKARGLLYGLAESTQRAELHGGSGRIFVFRIDPDTGKLTQIDCAETWCPAPCYMSLDESGRFLVVAHHSNHTSVVQIGQDAAGNYYPIVEWADSTVELFSVEEDGKIGTLLDVVKHSGTGPERRQTHPHPHSALRSPSGNLYAVCDKGNDTVRMYQIDKEKGKLVRPEHVYQQSPGKLPRHCVFHPEKPWFYHNNEGSPDLNAFTYTENGLLQPMGTYCVLPEDCEVQLEQFGQQGLVIDPQGTYLYGIMHDPNFVGVFEVNQNDGSLKAVQHQPIPGKLPRGCAMSPNGKFLLVGFMGSEKIVEFAIEEDGRLKETGVELSNPSPSTLLFCEM